MPSKKCHDACAEETIYHPFVVPFIPIPRFDECQAWAGTYESVFGASFADGKYVDPITFRPLRANELAKAEADFSKHLPHNVNSNLKQNKYLREDTRLSEKQISFCTLWNEFIGKLRIIPSDRQLYNACLYFAKENAQCLAHDLRKEFGFHLFNLAQHHCLSSVQVVMILESLDRMSRE